MVTSNVHLKIMNKRTCKLMNKNKIPYIFYGSRKICEIDWLTTNHIICDLFFSKCFFFLEKERVPGMEEEFIHSQALLENLQHNTSTKIKILIQDS